MKSLMNLDKSPSEPSAAGKTEVTGTSSAASDPAEPPRDAADIEPSPADARAESGKSPPSPPRTIQPKSQPAAPPASLSRPAPTTNLATAGSATPPSAPQPSLPVSMKQRPNSAAIINGSSRLAGEVQEQDFEVRLAQLGFADAAASSFMARIFAGLRSLIPFGRFGEESIRQQRMVAFDGFRSDLFEEKRERDRRYGTVYNVWEKENAFLVRLELPRLMPKSSLKETWEIPDEMPDYACTLTLADNVLRIRAGLPDEARRRLSYVSSSFPSDFETRIDFQMPVLSYSYRLHSKVLEVIVYKKTGSRRVSSNGQ
jgi:hypothetical protein